MSCMNTVIANRHQADEDRAERRADYIDQRTIELMQSGEDCDPCEGCNVGEAFDEAPYSSKKVLGDLLREGKFFEAGVFLRGISHAYWAAKSYEQAQEETT
jgi:hypothetical protein